MVKIRKHLFMLSFSHFLDYFVLKEFFFPLKWSERPISGRILTRQSQDLGRRQGRLTLLFLPFSLRSP